MKHIAIRSTIQKTNAFTLLELMVTVVILGVLGTIAFISLKDYSVNSRDAVRITDVKNIEKGFAVLLGKDMVLPNPDEAITISAGGVPVMYQGKFASSSASAIRLSSAPKDPLDGQNYVYATNMGHNVYQLLAYMEGASQTYRPSMFDVAYAAGYEGRIPRLFGKNLGIYLDENDSPIKTNMDVIGHNSPALHIYLDDTRVLRGTGAIVSQANPTSNCSRIFETSNNPKDGEYVVNPSGGAGFSVYCSRKFSEKNFYNFVQGGDMEGSDVMNQWTGAWNAVTGLSQTSEDRHSGGSSLKLIGGLNMISNNYTYIQPGKRYRLKGFFKLAPGSITPSGLLFGFAEYDEQFRFIDNRDVNAIPNTDTVLSANVGAGDTSASFACNDVIETAWRNNLVSHSTIVFETDDSGEYADLPNKKHSGELGRWPESTEDQARYRTQLLSRVGNICTLSLDPLIGNKIGKEYPAGTKIRMHQSGGTYNYRATGDGVLTFSWKEFSGEVNGISKVGVDNAYFRRGTKFVKIMILGNYYWRKEGGAYKSWQDNATLYIDDVDLEVVN